MTADRATYKCPMCDYHTHFLKALEAHQRHRKHFPAPEPVEVKEPEVKPDIIEETVPAEEPAVVVKKTRKPRKKAVKESEA